jgi:hypothetical protein
MNTVELRPAVPRETVFLARIALAGVAGGVVDAVYFSTLAWIQGRSPFRVLQSIASFWLGAASMHAGVISALLGFATHFGLAILMAAGYAAAATKLPLFRHRPRTAGPVYGLVLYWVMYYLVLPLRWPEIYPRFFGWMSGLDILAHMGVGLAMALVLARDPNIAREGRLST